MYTEFNTRIPEPPSNIEAWYDSFSLEEDGFVMTNWHDGLMLDPENPEERLHADFQYVKTNEWIKKQDPATCSRKLKTKALLAACDKKGYSYQETVIQRNKVFEISLPNGKLWAGADEDVPDVNIGFINFALFAECEKPDAFLDSMNDLLKYLSDIESEYPAAFEVGKQRAVNSAGV